LPQVPLPTVQQHRQPGVLLVVTVLDEWLPLQQTC
jgi:hypothetical protein